MQLLKWESSFCVSSMSEISISGLVHNKVSPINIGEVFIQIIELKPTALTEQHAFCFNIREVSVT